MGDPSRFFAPVRLSNANPFSFVSLLSPKSEYNKNTKGRMARLSWVFTIMRLDNGVRNTLAPFANIGLENTSVYMTIMGVCVIPNGILCGPLIKLIGSRGNTTLGNLGNALGFLGTAVSTSPAMLYMLAIPQGIFYASAAVKGAMATAASSAGIGQGKAMADIGNLQAATEVFMPLVYGWAWRFFGSYGGFLLGAPFLIAAGTSFLSEVLHRAMLTDADFDGK